MIPPTMGEMPPFYHSRGRYTAETTGAALQELVNDLEGFGGTVFVCQQVTLLLQPLDIPPDVFVDFQGNSAQLGNEDPESSVVTRTSLVKFDNCQNAHIRNVRVLPLVMTDPESSCSDNQSDPIVLIQPTSGGVRDCGVRRVMTTTREQAVIEGGLQTAPLHCFNAIEIVGHLEHSISANHFLDIFHTGVCNGVVLREGPPGSGEIDGNLFSNLALYRCQSLVSFVPAQNPSERGFLHNTIEIIRSQSDPLITVAGVRFVSGTGNHFDHLFSWDFWYTSGCCDPANLPADFHISPGAVGTYINADAVYGLLNEGRSGRVLAPRIPCASSVATQLDCSCSIEPLCTTSACSTPGGFIKTPVPLADYNETYCFCASDDGTVCNHVNEAQCVGNCGTSVIPSAEQLPHFDMPLPKAGWPAPETRIDHHPPKILTWRELGHPEPSLAGGIHTSPSKVLTWRDFSPGAWFW